MKSIHRFQAAHWALWAFLAPSLALAQDATTTTAEEEVFELSPFEVDGSQDTGYRAANTLAGSRLNTALRDVSAVIDVYTKEFMDDLGTTDLEDVALYANNLVPDTEDTRSGTGNIGVQASSGFSFRIRGLTATRARNYFAYDFPSDTYNVGRLDESRGPNAILFGFGSPGGIISFGTKRANFGRNPGYIKLSTGTEIQNRVELDFNHIVIDDVLAVRLNALHHEENGWKEYTHDDREAVTASITFKPFKKTNIVLEYENYEQHDERARPITFYDRGVKWKAAGTPLLAGGWGQRRNATLNPDLESSELTFLRQLIGTNDNNNDAYWVLFDNTNELYNYRGLVRADWPRENGALPDGSNLTFFNGGRQMSLEPDGIIEVNILGPGAFRDFKVRNSTFILQQEVTKDLNFELAATKNSADWEINSAFASTLEGDPNLWLPGASVTDNLPDPANPVINPFAGMSYFETQNDQRTTTEDYEVLRFSASYEFDFLDRLSSDRLGYILGKHRFGILYEKNQYVIEEIQMREQIFIDGVMPRPDLAGNTRNKVYRRHYITDPSNPLDYVNGSNLVSKPPLNVTLDDGSVLTSAYVPFLRRWDFTRDNTSKMFAMQNFWLDGRFVTTFGKRKDTLDFAAYSSMDDDIGGVVRDVDSLETTPYEGDTMLIGGVFHLTPNFSVFYNDSDSIGVPTLPIFYVPTGDFNDTTIGEGRDFGIKLSLFDDRLFLTASAFEASQQNETEIGGVQNWVGGRQDRVVDALVVEGFLTPEQGDANRVEGTGFTADSDTKGVEVSLVGRITENWNIRMNYSWTDREVANVAPRIRKWTEEYLLPFYAAYDRVNPNDPDGGNILDTVLTGSNTMRDELEGYQSDLSVRLSTAERVIGLRRHKFNFFTTYRFDEGRLKGFQVGAGARYVSAPVVTQEVLGVDERGALIKGDDVYGESNLSVDLQASYKMKLMDHRFTFQVNVRNAFREHADWSTINIEYADNIESIVIFPPREITFSARMDF